MSECQYCDFYSREIKKFQTELLEYKEAARSEASLVNELQAENAKLRECVEFYADIWERRELYGELLVRKMGSTDNFTEVHYKARQVLKELEEK